MRIGAGAPHVELGKVDRADPEVVASVEHAPVGERARAGKQPGTPVPQPRQPRDLLGDLRHLLTALEITLSCPAIHMPDVECDQPAGCVQNIDHRPLSRVGIADEVAEHGGQPDLRRETGHPGCSHRIPRPAMGRHLHYQIDLRQQLPPLPQGPLRQIRPTARKRPSQLRLGADQKYEPSPAVGGLPGMLGHQRGRGDRRPALPAKVGGTHEPAKCGPAAATRGENGDARLIRIDESATSHWSSTGRSAFSTECRLYGEVGTQDRADACLRACLDEPDRAVKTVAICQSQRLHPVLGRALDEHRRQAGAMPQGIAGGNVEVDERVHYRATS